MQGKTSSGFEYIIPDENLNDYELFELIAEVGENALLLPKIVDKLLGIDGKKALLDHCRNEQGKVPMEKINNEVAEIFSNQKQIKNS